jgi:heptosyltransferase-3
MSASGFSSFLVVRRDNIGDLVCTTPLLAGLRRRHPEAFIGVLVNTYNRDVLAGNPDVDEIYAYAKAKHRESGETLVGVYAERIRLFVKLRRTGFDCAVLAAPGFQRHALQLARLAGARRVAGFVSRPGEGRIDLAVPYGAPTGLHEVEDVWRLGAVLGMEGPPPSMKVVANPGKLSRVREALASAASQGARGPLVALHISARKTSQRWPVERFAELIRRLHALINASFLLLWSPGNESNPRHPGDDEKAAALARFAGEVPMLAWRTDELGELVAALAASDAVVCSDGGAMHIAAALSKPIVCFFGDSAASRWRPWEARHELLQPASRDIRDVSVEDAVAACERLIGT